MESNSGLVNYEELESTTKEVAVFIFRPYHSAYPEGRK